MHQYRSGFILQWYLLSPRTKNKQADCYVDLSHECAVHASARHAFDLRHRHRSRVGKTTLLLCRFPTPAHTQSRISPSLPRGLSMRGVTSTTRSCSSHTMFKLLTFWLKSHKRTQVCLISQPGLVFRFTPSGAGVNALRSRFDHILAHLFDTPSCPKKVSFFE